MLLLIIKGIMIGFAIAAPVGPSAVMVIQRTMTRRWVHGVIAGVGASIADTLFGAIAAFGLSWIQDWLQAWSLEIRLIGGIVLVVKGLWMMREPAPRAANTRESGLLGALTTTFALTLFNPITFFAFVGILATFNVVSDDLTWTAASVLCGSVFVGAMSWWLALVALASLFRGHLLDGRMVWVNRAAGGVLIACGLLLLYGYFIDPDLLNAPSSDPAPVAGSGD